MMNALVPGSKSINDCAAAGWPIWLAAICVHIYDELPEDLANFYALKLATWIASVDEEDLDKAYVDFMKTFVVPTIERALDSFEDQTDFRVGEIRKRLADFVASGYRHSTLGAPMPQWRIGMSHSKTLTGDVVLMKTWDACDPIGFPQLLATQRLVHNQTTHIAEALLDSLRKFSK